jgi:hypothetical protein
MASLPGRRMASANGLALGLTTTPRYEVVTLMSSQCERLEKQLPLQMFPAVNCPGRAVADYKGQASRHSVHPLRSDTAVGRHGSERHA